MKTLTHVQKAVAATVVALTSTLVLVACGSAGTDVKANFNDADVEFASGMIPHHQQAVVMSDWAATRASDPKVKDLAKRITAAQGPEITLMTTWLKTWDKPVPDAYDAESEEGSEHSAHSMEGMEGGMMSADDMATLKKAKGAAFDQEYLAQMIAHHKGAVTMARTELADGKDADAKRLAGAVIAAQTDEIDEMAMLLK